MTLYQFINSKEKNRWLSEPQFKLKVYVRRGVHVLTSKHGVILQTRGDLIPCLDLASVEVQAKYRGQGYFTRFLKHAEKMAERNGWAVYVESVLEPRLEKFLYANGYNEVYGQPHCYFKVDFEGWSYRNVKAVLDDSQCA